MQTDRQEHPLISIIIPTYNEAENILELIHTINDNCSFKYELIVVDDNSPDGTAELVENYATKNCKSYIEHEPEMSPATT